jgi:beta-lactamase regulating signal transducer with metallopeptidase domain
MRELAAFLAECIATGALFYNACALLVVPIAAWSLIRLLAPTITRMDDDPTAQAWFAGSAALVPGVLLLTLAGFALVSGLQSDCLRTLAGRVLFVLVAAGLVAATVRASSLFWRRSHDVRAFVRVTRPASGRLARIAKRAGVAVREFDDPAPTCMLAGIHRPTVLDSTGAVELLLPAELEAAILHERGHARHHDQLIAAGLSFVVDLLPLPAGDLVATYRRAREFAADDHALQTAQAPDLAAALLVFVNSPKRFAGLAASMGDHAGSTRLARILSEQRAVTVVRSRRIVVAAALAAMFLAGVAPAAAAVLIPCPMPITRFSP